MDFREMMRLEEHGPDTYVGVGPTYPWGGLYGGQIVAQALRAAFATVGDDTHVHSLHAYFIRKGDSAEPIRFEVDRLRNGRSFTTRAVVARQSSGAILNMSASFQVDEDGKDVQAAQLPPVPPAESLPRDSWTSMFDRRMVAGLGTGISAAWFSLDDIDDPVLAACALAYLSDDLPCDAVRSLHEDGGPGHEEWNPTSLDHAIWFHRHAPRSGWQLHHFLCHGLLGSRGLAVGEIFSGQGTHIATVAQEALLRRIRPAAANERALAG